MKWREAILRNGASWLAAPADMASGKEWGQPYV